MKLRLNWFVFAAALWALILTPVYALDTSLDFDVSIGSLVGKSSPAEPRGQVPFWGEVQSKVNTGLFNIHAIGVLGHQSAVDRNGDERNCDYYGAGLEAKVAHILYLKGTANKCFGTNNSVAEGDTVYRAEVGIVQGNVRFTAFYTEAEGQVDFAPPAEQHKNHRAFGLKAGYQFKSINDLIKLIPFI